MGNIVSTKLNKVGVDPPVTYPVKIETRGCHYCKKDINFNESYLSCTNCDVIIHRYCYYSNNRDLKYTKCPRCSSVETLGFSSNI